MGITGSVIESRMPPSMRVSKAGKHQAAAAAAEGSSAGDSPTPALPEPLVVGVNGTPPKTGGKDDVSGPMLEASPANNQWVSVTA